jgi:tRNA(Ile)-lysidine synthase
VRGTGLRGLRGIAPVAPLGNACLLRPLLAVGRAGVLSFLAELGQPFRTDSSNADPRFTRNRIRAEVLPLLATVNPDAVAALNRAAEQAGEAFEFIDRLAADLLARAELPRAGHLVILDAAALTAADPTLAREAFRRLWEREGWPTSQFRASQWHRLLAVAHGDPPAADFPGGVAARRAGRVVRVGRRS